VTTQSRRVTTEDTSLARSRSAPIPESKSCSVFVTGPPGKITTNKLLAAIRDTGCVWASVISPLVTDGGTAPAKVTVFFTSAAAQTFLDGLGRPGFIIDGHQVLVRPDRNNVPAAEEPENVGRCITITGPRDIITEEYLPVFFGQRSGYETDLVDFLVRG
jgi:hypothetical protein